MGRPRWQCPRGMPLACAGLIATLLLVANASSKSQQVAKSDASTVQAEAYTEHVTAHDEDRTLIYGNVPSLRGHEALQRLAEEIRTSGLGMTPSRGQTPGSQLDATPLTQTGSASLSSPLSKGGLVLFGRSTSPPIMPPVVEAKDKYEAQADTPDDGLFLFGKRLVPPYDGMFLFGKRLVPPHKRNA